MTTHLESAPPELMSSALRSAAAWNGGFSWTDYDEFDPKEWERERPSWSPDEAKIMAVMPVGDSENGERIVLVLVPDPATFWRHVSSAGGSRSNTVGPGSLYADPDNQKVRDHWYSIVAWREDDRSDLLDAMALPRTDGVVFLSAVLAQNDEFVPVSVDWLGKHVTESEARGRVREVLDALRSIRILARVPAPELPPHVTALIQQARRGKAPKAVLVDSLLELGRDQFLEAIDRLVPWMVRDGGLGWMSNDRDLCERTWTILDEVPGLEGSMRLAPWKSGLANPSVQKILVTYSSSNRGTGRFYLDRDPETGVF